MARPSRPHRHDCPCTLCEKRRDASVQSLRDMGRRDDIRKLDATWLAGIKRVLGEKDFDRFGSDQWLKLKSSTAYVPAEILEKPARRNLWDRCVDLLDNKRLVIR